MNVLIHKFPNPKFIFALWKYPIISWGMGGAGRREGEKRLAGRLREKNVKSLMNLVKV